MKKITIFSLLFLAVIISGCSTKSLNNNQSTAPNSSINSTRELSVQTADKTVDVQEAFKTYSNTDLGITFNYPKEWPEPTLIKNKIPNGSYFDNNNQWEIGLGEAQKIEGEIKYPASIRGYYSQDKKEVMSQLNDANNKGSLWFIDQFENNQSSYIVYGEAGITQVKDIMFFGPNEKTIRIQSLGATLDSDIHSIALSIRNINSTEDSVKKDNIKEEIYKGWFVFYTKESDIKNTNLKLNAYYLVKKDDINKDFTFVQFDANKSSIDLLELIIASDCNFVSPKNDNKEQKYSCSDSIKGYPSELFGDRVTVAGTLKNGKLLVKNLTLNSFSPIEQW